MSGETTQQELVWVSPEDYESSVEGDKESIKMDEGEENVDLPSGADLPAILIENGLQLRMKGETKPFDIFNYCPAPMMTHTTRVDWKMITNDPSVVGHHILCHKLQPQDKLPELIKSRNIEFTRALVLVTSDNSYLLSRDFMWEGMPPPPFPVCVINNENGVKLLDIISQHDVGDVHGNISNKSISTDDAMKCKSPTPEDLSLTLEEVKSKHKRPRLFHRPKLDLKKRLKEIMVSPTTGPLCVSENKEMFARVMEEFCRYEVNAKSKQQVDADTNSRVLQKLLKFISSEEVFQKDALFYILLAYRVFRFQNVYSCDELSHFIHKCILKFEEMMSKKLLESLFKFIENGELLICWEEEAPTTSVFSLLEKACIVLSKESAKVKSKGLQAASQTHRLLLCKMLWLTVSLKFKSLTGLRDGSKTWYDHMTKDPHHYSLDHQSTDDLAFALQFAIDIKLPVEAHFSIEQLGHLMASDHLVRPFCHLSGLLKKVVGHLHVPNDFLEHIIIKLREPYRQCLEPATKKLENISTYNNLLGAIQEGLEFLDTIVEMWKDKNWSHPSFDSEMCNWVELLLGTVDVTSEKVVSYLKEFLNQMNHPVCSQYQRLIIEKVINEVRNNFNRLSILKFSRLFTTFYIWPAEVVNDYLISFSQRIPQRLHIDDKLWVEFLTAVVDRFPGAGNHSFLLEFLTNIGDHYLSEKRPKDFIFHLLNINIPGLFAVESGKETSHAAQSIPVSFKTILREYIQRNRLSSSVVGHITAIWKSITDMSDFQLLILSVLEKELIPESRNLQAPIKPSVKAILEDTVKLLSYDASWLEELTLHHKFAFGVVSVCCSLIPLAEGNLAWILSYDQVIEKLGSIYACYCKAKGITGDGTLLQSVPQDIASIPCEDISAYFQWIIDIQRILTQWKRAFTDKSLTYDSLQHYNHFYINVHNVGNSLGASSLVVDTHVSEGSKTDYLKLYERLNIHLIKYITGHPEASWLLLPSLLNVYGIEIPEKILVPLSQQIVYPGESTEDTSIMISEITPAITGAFRPGHDVSLKLASNVTLFQLMKLVHDLDELLSPIQDNLDLLIYFFLHKSSIFDTYLRYQLKKHSGLTTPQDPPASMQSSLSRVRTMTGAFLNSIRRGGEPFKGISWQILADSLKATKELIVRIVEGSAQYSDVTAGGNLALEKMDLEFEFKVLVEYTRYLHGEGTSYEGLHGIQCMLELFQYTHHINNVFNVCEQYHMKGCLEDTRLQEIKDIANELQEVSSRDQMTPKDAIEKVNKIVTALCLKKRGLSYDRNCLLLFPAISDSAVFYQFIKDKGFYGEDGQEVFRQQYELITAQLQHEEYNEVVLNHLLIAFQFISPFVDDSQDFLTLMTEVQKMKISPGCQELRTVNKNIHLVRLWFSRAEEDTLEMVPAELEAILTTGEYQFVFDTTPDGIKALLFLEYQPPSVTSHAAMTPGKQPEVSPNESIPTHRDSLAGEDTLLRSTISYTRDSTSSPTPTTHLRLQRWSSAQIRDFEQRIGFLDSELDLSQNINKFLMFNQNAYRLLDLYQRLNDLGHPLYTELEPQRNMTKEDQPKEIPIPFKSLGCSATDELVRQKVEEAEEELQVWTSDVDKLQTQFESLLFFSIPKLRHVHKRLAEGHVDNVVAEISFLFKNNVIVREKMKSSVKSVLPHIKPLVESCTAPMKVVGSFLHQLFDQDMSRFALQPRHPYRQLQRTLSAQTSTVLHSCHGLTSAQLISLIINCYNGVPESFQLFRCQKTTTEDELMLFLKRANQYAFQYMIVGVEQLQYQLQELLLQFQLKSRPNLLTDGQGASLHFVETGPSILREMPWIMVKDHKDGISLNIERAKKLCRQGLMAFEDFQCITLVYGHAGDGKTHLIKTRLRNRLAHMVLHIPVNEAFTPLSAIKKLQTLPMDTRGCCIYFNFTVLPPSEALSGQLDERQQYIKLMETVNWFFFDLLVLGYVEDPTTGESFRLPGGLSWGIFIEVPSCRADAEPSQSLTQFIEHVPILGLVGNKEYVEPKRQYVVDEGVQLVCKYLKAFETGGKNGIDKLYKDSNRKSKIVPLVKFSEDADLERDECVRLLDKYTPAHMKHNKTTQKLFVSYMRRRCHFLDNLPAYNYNTGGTEMITTAKGKRLPNNTRQLGSTLMKSFLKEVTEFCDPDGQADWSKKPHEQLIYDTVDGGSSIGLISLRSEKLGEEEETNYEQIGIQIPSLVEMHSRVWLDDYLSRALNVPLDENGRLKIIDDSSYVLTLDYTLKMLNIHERHECGMPVIIEGETGVGKTALVEVLSKLWNSAHLYVWHKARDTILEFMQRKMDDLLEMSPDHKTACLDVISNLSKGEGDLTEEDLQMIMELPDSRSPSAQFHSILLKEMMKLKDEPVLSLLELPETENKKSFHFLFRNAEYRNCAKTTAELLHKLFTATVKNTFHKLNVHAALMPSDVIAFFKEVSNQAYEIEDSYNKSKDNSASLKVPSVSVFLDEINTASCLGLFKEIIVDKSIDGTAIPSNVFIIGACNPHRGDSLAAAAQDESWIRSNYYVRILHPTLDMLKWDYGSLDEYQEQDYINAKLRLIHQEKENVELASLAELIIVSQNMMRALAYNQLRSLGVDEINATTCSKSSVSQRDIQRVFTFYEWLTKLYNKFKPYGPGEDYHRNAIMVSLSLVYYMRLSDGYRRQYCETMDKSAHLSGGRSFSDIFEREINWYVDNMDIPQGIAKTQALKENIFGTILCTMTHTPLIIVGPPGCSKTLSFNLVTANLRGQESKVKLFRETDLFHSLDPHYYQCSRRTTSNEIQTVFSRSINRQRTYASVPLPIDCVVFMDEAGLPEESLESLKILHYHLDRREVSFVAISNHMLDAAKTNRAVSLYRSEPSIDELRVLAKGCLCDTPDDPPPELKKDIELIVKFCPLYHKFMEMSDFRRFYGLRDFIHFINFLKRQRGRKGITEKVVMHALERNFNGHKLFDSIAREFLGVMGPNAIQHVNHHSILDILHDSVKDQPQLHTEDNEVRYKLVIDSSEDNSLLRLLFAFGVLKEKDTRTYMCSDFPGDAHQQTINTIAAIRHSAAAGHTVIMSQTDELHESFYDLFNQRFRRIDDPKTGPRYYANIAIGAHHKPCRVHPSFQCVVVVKASEVEDIPHPFLNRFEKYSLTHKTLLDAVLRKQPSYLRSVIQRAHEKVREFIEHVDGPSSLYGFHDDTLDSLVLSILPPVGFQEFLETDKPKKPETLPEGISPEVFLLRRLLRALRKRAGFRIPHFTREELLGDAEHVIRLVSRDSQFAGQLSSLKHEDVLQAVPEALQGLYHSKKGGRTDLSINACMVISVFLQWLVRHLCKRLMQLMTTEALTSRYRSLPHPYTESYLKHQSHFSLQALIDKQLQVMELDDRTDRSTTGTANRLLIFTRSSALIHQLPARYPLSNSSPLSYDYDDLIRNLVYYYTEDVAICKLSSITSQASMNDVLNSFWLSKKQRVMLLVANMKETSSEMISHLRVMIEENDTGEKLKLFVVLLHFPPSMFTSSCYPTLFSNTWDHHYLDIIGQNTTGQVMDICEWLSLCCSYLKSHHSQEKQISMHLSALLLEAIPTISSRVFFGKVEDVPFNCPMDAPTRNKSIQKLFDTGVGKILSDKFLKYWEPGVMFEYLEKAAALTTTIQTSTLSITDSVQRLIRDTFFDYIVYMIAKMNEDMNIDILMDPDCTPATRELFLSLLRSYPMPKLSQLKALSSFEHSISSLESSQHTPYIPKFPFYRTVSSAVEKIVDQTRKEINQRLDTLHEFPDPIFSISQMSITSLPKVIEDKSHLVVSMQKAVEEMIEQMLHSSHSSPLKVALQAMKKDPQLMRNYSEAFTHQKLRLGASTAGISYRILRLTFTQLHPDQNLLTRLVLLHVCMHVYQLDLSRLVQVLRPIDALLDMAATVPDDPFAESHPSPTASFLTAVQESGDLLGQPGDLSKYVLRILFSALAGSVMGQFEESVVEENVFLWYQVYRDVMSMSAVKDYLYKNLNGLSETQHNIMQATFLTIQGSHGHDEKESFNSAIKIFNVLFNAHLTEGLEMKKGAPPRLQEVADIIIQELVGSSIEVALSRHNSQLRRILEGLFNHYFSTHLPVHNSQDIEWFLKTINKNSHWNIDTILQVTKGEDGRSLEDYEDQGCIPLSVYHYYLTIVLNKADVSTNGTGSSTVTSLTLYKPWVREMVGTVLVNSVPDSYKPGPYIPTFYQNTSGIKCPDGNNNKLMQQPLAHLYFVTVLRHLLSNDFTLTGLLKVAIAISENLEEDTKSHDKVLHYIEKQGVVQAIIQQLAKCLNPTNPNGIGMVANIVTDLNHILDDESLGGGDVGGHGLVLSLSLLKELSSFRKFAELLGPNSFCKDFNVLVRLSTSIELPEEEHLFPFLVSTGKGNTLKDLYDRVGRAMLTAHTSTGRKVSPLVTLAQEWSQGQLTISLPDGHDVHGEKSAIFRMIFWLNTYYKFYCQKKSSTVLVDMVKDQLLYVIQPAPLNKLICCFLDPSYMISEPTLDSESASYEDPIFAFFNPDTKENSSSDISLRHAIANLISVVVAAPTTSTHLWYHMFTPEQLSRTHIAGFMLETPVGQDGLFYDSGVQLTPSGQYGQQSYLKHATRGTLSLQSLYLLLWANAGAFCIGLLTDGSIEDKMKGSVFPEYMSVRGFCMKQLKTMWNHMSTSMGISVEERSFLVSRSMWNMLKLACSNSQMSAGKFTTITPLNIYESAWYSSVFMPVWNTLKDEYSSYARLYDHDIFKNIKDLESYYPCFTSQDSLLQSLLSDIHIGDPYSSTEHLLAQLVLQQRQLEMGGVLLSDLVELYQWLHQELGHVLTRSDAETIPVSRAVRVLAKSYSPEEGERLQNLYKRLRDCYNQYQEIKGTNNDTTLQDTTPLSHVLSYSSDGDTGPDLLYNIISDIITTHNNFLMKGETVVRSESESPLCRYLPKELPRVHPTEFTDQNCIIEKSSSLQGLTEFELLIGSSSTLPSPLYGLTGSHTSLPGWSPGLINLQQLQEDVFARYVAGKPLIGPPQSLRTNFAFRDAHHAKENLSAIEADLETITSKLLDEFKCPMDDNTIKTLEQQFHNSSYHIIMETVSGLRGVAGHLIKKLMGISQSELMELDSFSVSEFLTSVFDTREPLKSITGSKKSIFHEIGLHNLTPNQFAALENLHLSHLHDALRWFVMWISQGWYEFCSLPYVVKIRLTPPDVEALMTLPEHYTDTSEQLLKQLKALVMVLGHFESTSTITSMALKDSLMSIVDLLSRLGECREQEDLIQLIPESVLLQNYVHFRVILKRLITDLQKKLSSESLSITPHKKSWEDFVDDLWKNKLSDFRNGNNYSYAVISTADQKRRVYSLRNIDRNDEDLLNDLMNAGVSESNLLPDTDAEEGSRSPSLNSRLTQPSIIATGVADDEDDVENSFGNVHQGLSRTKRLAETYTCEQVCAFLDEISLGEYKPQFEEYSITGEILLNAGKGKGLEELGVLNPLHRLKICVLFRRKLEGVSKIAKRYPTEEVVRFLHSMKMSQYVPEFEKNKIDGELLLEASHDVLEQLGVTMEIQCIAILANFKKYTMPRSTTL